MKGHAKYLGVVIGPGAAGHRWARNKFIGVCVPASAPPRRAGSKDTSLSRPMLFPSFLSLRRLLNLTQTPSLRKTWHSRGFRQARFTRFHLPCFEEEVLVLSKLMFLASSSRVRLPIFALPLSAVLSTGIARIRAAKDCCGRTLDSFARSWDD